ncbi:hypothetical protein [Streptomyces sp. NBC_01477]|uniref:hypothetical protein n=1 Tax=Streptomyces sp. NBC_01477 TaxID=2976015 RepID=UPI002E30C848|nr:hypothetical protein [Streptomyces sp. NBC_01477]
MGERPPAGVREQVDGYVLQDAFIRAVRTVFDAGRGSGPGLNEAQHVVNDRYRHHGDTVARTPDSPVDPGCASSWGAGLSGPARRGRGRPPQR